MTAPAIFVLVFAALLASPQAMRAPVLVQAPAPRVIEVVARRFAFEPPEIEAVQGERIRIAVTSGDGMHGFEIKRFRISKEIPRGGDPVIIDFTPNEAGRFPILCSVFCGDGHGDMRGALVVTARPAEQP